MERRTHYSNELVRNGWLDETAVVSDDVIEALYTDLLSELMEGDSPDFEDSDRTVAYEENAVGGMGLATLANAAMISRPPSPTTTPPPSQARRREALDIGELVAAASTAAKATAWFAPDASSALSALAAAASAIAGTASTEGLAGPRPSTNAGSTTRDATTSAESRQHDHESTGTEVARGASASVEAGGSAPPQICIICAEEMTTPGLTNICGHRDCCRRCLWRILREGDRRCPLCRRQYQRVW